MSSLIRDGPQHDERHDSEAPAGTATRGRLEFVRGASLVTIGAGAAMPDLYRAHFEGPAPRVTMRDGTVSIHYRRLSLADWAKYALLWGWHAAEITLNTAIPWQIEIRGGVSKFRADLREICLVSLEVRGGASEVEALLPPPSGIVVVHIGGGASNVTLRRPSGAAVGVQVRGGASKLTFDDQHFGAIGGGVRLATAGYSSGANRYDISIAGGASRLTIETYPE
jgi:hypothetical protein